MSKARDLASAAPAPSTVSATELGYLDGVTSAIQTQINSKEATLPSQTGNSGKYLTTDGSTKSWGTVSQYALPTQTGNSGKFLTTNGTSESWGTVSSGGLVLIASGTVSGSTQLNIDNVFSSTYDFYKVTIELKNTNSNTLYMRWLTSGTPLTAASYYYAWLGYTWNGSTNNRSTAGGDFIDMGTIQNSPQPFDLTFNKNASNELHCTGQWLGYGNSGYFNGGAHSTAQQAFTGIRLYNGGGFLTGRWSVYGYVK